MHESFNNYYSILGISQKASHNDIKKAYRKLSLDNHPDRNGNNKDKCEKFKEITQAYKILSDETERKNYDLSNTNNLVGLDSNIQNILNNLMSNINYLYHIKFNSTVFLRPSAVALSATGLFEPNPSTPDSNSIILFLSASSMICCSA